MTLQKDNDNRHFHRIFYKSDATLNSGANVWPCDIVDLSIKGCLLRFDFPWQENPEKTYTLMLPLSEDTGISMALSVSHVVDNTVGFKCEHIDIESLSNLRRLVELNLGDSGLLERDLIALCGL